MKQFDPLWAKGIWHEAQTGDVPPWASKTDDEFRSYRIGYSHHDHGDSFGGILGSLNSGRIDGYNHVDLGPQQLLCKSWKAFGLSGCIPHVYADAGSLNIAELVKLVAECLQQARLEVLGKNANSVCHCGLRVGAAWQCHHGTTQEFKKFPPPHASASSVRSWSM